MVRYITDKDFVPTSISYCNPWKTDAEKGLFQIVYGTLQQDMTYDRIYELIIGILKVHESEVVRRFYLESWSKEIQAIIDRLGMIDKQDKRVVITIPFLFYVNIIPYTQNRFRFVKFAINELLAKGCGQMEVSDNLGSDYPLRELDDVFDFFRVHFERRLSIAGRDKDIDYLHSLLHDELYRRGFRKIKDSRIMSEGERYTIIPSEYYKQPERFLGILDWDDDCKQLKIKYEAESEDDSSGNDSENNVNAKEMAGIVYFMLKATFKEAFETGDKKKLVEFFNFVLDNLSAKGKERKPDTARHYIGQFKRIPNAYQSQRFYDTVKEALNKYNFAIPEAIKEATEVSTKHSKVR